MYNFDKEMMNNAINEYLSHLPECEQKELRDWLESNLEFYSDFSSRMFNLSSLLLMFTHAEQIDQSVINDFINKFINQGYSNNKYINNMYRFYLENMSDNLSIQYGQEQGNIIFNGFRSVIEKTFLNAELCNELFQNDKEVAKSKI